MAEVLPLEFLVPFYWDREKLNNLPRVTELGSSRLQTWTQLFLTPNQLLILPPSLGKSRENEIFTAVHQAQFLEPQRKPGNLALGGEEAPEPSSRLPVGELIMTIEVCHVPVVFENNLGLKRNNNITKNDLQFITLKSSCLRKSQQSCSLMHTTFSS